jgi:hypothetical protein
MGSAHHNIAAQGAEYWVIKKAVGANRSAVSVITGMYCNLFLNWRLTGFLFRLYPESDPASLLDLNFSIALQVRRSAPSENFLP